MIGSNSKKSFWCCLLSYLPWLMAIHTKHEQDLLTNYCVYEGPCTWVLSGNVMLHSNLQHILVVSLISMNFSRYCIIVYCFDTPLWTCIHCALHYLPSDIRSILQSVRTGSRIVYVRSTGPQRTLQAWRECQDSLWYVCSVLWCTLPSLKVRPCIFLSCFHVQGILKFFKVVRYTSLYLFEMIQIRCQTVLLFKLAVKYINTHAIGLHYVSLHIDLSSYCLYCRGVQLWTRKWWWQCENRTGSKETEATESIPCTRYSIYYYWASVY